MTEYNLRMRLLCRLEKKGRHKVLEGMIREAERFFLELDYECLTDTEKATLDFCNTPSWERQRLAN